MIMYRGILIVTLTLFNLVTIATLAQAQQSGANRTAPASNSYIRANRGTVGIVSGDIDSTAIHAASDLSRVLDDGDNLRIVPFLGKGSVQNVSDMLFLKGVDVGIVQSDVLSFFRRTKRFPGIENRLAYITKLYNEEFHVLSSMKYLCIDDLGGRRVNFGLKDSGTAMTAEAVFAAHKVQVERYFYDQTTALQKLKNGELDAIVFVSGKPARTFNQISYKDRVHFLDVTYVDDLQGDYLPATISNEDYPDLVAPNEKVATVAVGAVMAVYNWKSSNPRYRKVKGFIDAFFSNIKNFREPPRHPKWREVNLSSSVPGWKRFSAAKSWLAKQKKTPRVASSTARRGTQTSQNAFQKFLQSVGGNLGNMSSAQREQLFKQFIRWQNQQAQ